MEWLLWLMGLMLLIAGFIVEYRYGKPVYAIYLYSISIGLFISNIVVSLQ